MRFDIGKTLNGRRVVQLTLLVSGVIAVGIAATILFAPGVFYAGYGIEIGGDPTLVNELKAPAGALFFAGLLMLAGVFRTELVGVSLATASVIYLTYGLSRLLSMAIDGLPHSGLVSAALIELGIGAVCLLTLLSVGDKNTPRKYIRKTR